MPFFRYDAVDAAGRPRSGSIQAGTISEAESLLGRAGLNRVRVKGGMSNTPSPSPPPARPVAVAARPAPLAQPVVPQAVVAPIEKTSRLSDKRRFFLFSQLGRFFRSAVSPVTALEQLISQASEPGLRRALEDGKGAMTAGTTLADAFAKYPRLFPHDVIGTLRAGQDSGEIAEACERIAEQSRASHALKRQLFWYSAILILTACTYPFVLMVVRGSLDSISEQDKAGGNLPVVPTILKFVQVEAIKIAPVSILIGALCIAAYLFWMSDRFRLQRHRLVLSLPLLGKRAWAESMARFGWALSTMSKGGVSARQAFGVAAETPPNAWMSEELKKIAASMGEADKVSGTLQRAGLFPAETVHIVSNGEMAGDLPGAIMSTAHAAESEFSARDSSWAQLSRYLFYIPFGILILLMCISLYTTLYGGIIQRLTAD